jgi:predicted nucleic acid-binding protein
MATNLSEKKAATRANAGLRPDQAAKVRASAHLHCRDPDDQMFLDLALAAGARWLVSRDRALLHLRRRAQSHGLAIVTPEQWQAP